jgi:hypothetical protein
MIFDHLIAPFAISFLFAASEMLSAEIIINLNI